MWYVEVFVASTAYHKDEPLTYSSASRLSPGQIVVVPLRNKAVMAIVAGIVPKPTFAAKQIVQAPALPLLPAPLQELLAWMRSYYPAPLGIITQLFLPASLPNKPLIKEIGALTEQDLPPLTPDQQKALESIAPVGLHILHGETGSGKTRIYTELAKRSFTHGKSSVILTPEIGLTSQLAQTLGAVFGDHVITIHSGLSDVARRQLWQWVLTQKKPLIIIGARSALFTPLHNIGLLVVDESHETAYKQDQAPYYHASTVAARLAAAHRAALVLGSATPLVSDYYIAQAKHRPIIRMQQVAAGTGKALNENEIRVIDLRDRTQFTKSPYLSNALIENTTEKLRSGEQVLLFLNRRGTARVVFCDTCGWQATCPHCDLPLVYHGDQHIMRCHSCSYKAQPPSSCPNCTSAEVVFKSVGTKAITLEAQRLFPEARIMRFDTDNKKSERLEMHFDALHSGEVDILIGTQTLAKGLDLPKLGLVGVVIADTSLYFPDFSAQERTYQLLGQVLGRIGRGHRNGLAIVQTYSPDSSLLDSVLSKDWSTFYNNELIERKRFLFPPFCYLMKVTCKRATSQSAQAAALALASQLRSNNYNVLIEGPTPAFREKVQNKYAWQLIVKSKKRDQLTKIIRQLPSGWAYDIDPMNLL